MSKEAMKLALELLDRQWQCEQVWSLEESQDVANIIREALAEQKSGIKQVIELYDSPDQPAQQEPVAWMYVNKSTHETKFQKHMRDFVDHSLWSEVPLYGEPLANHELQCVCGAVWLGDELVHLPDKRPPAQRTWVGLTDEDKKTPDMGKYVFLNDDWIDGYKTGLEKAEAKLKEKNNGN